MKKIILFSRVFLGFGLGFLMSSLSAQTNIAPSGTFSHSGGGSGTFGPQNYNDGIIQTGTFGWVSGTGGPNMWIECDWSSSQTFDKITVWPDQTTNRFLASGDIEVWTGSSWTKHTSFTAPSTRPYDITFTPVSTTKFRFINMTVTGSQSSNPSVNEIQVWEAILAANNAAVLAIDSPSVFCEGDHNIVATIQNRGINQIDSVRVNWTFDGSPQPTFNYTSTLDTLKGTGSSTAMIVLGNKTFNSGVTHDIKVWTSMPNGVQDTFNFDDTVSVKVRPAIYGNFTIDPNGSGSSNYPTFAACAKDLSDFGVCGPVVITVKPGTYNEQFSLDEINGASAMNTIQFVPDTGGTVTLEYGPSGSTNNYVVQFNGADWVSFENMVFQVGSGGSTSYRTVLEMGGGSSYNRFENCQFNGYSNSSTSTYQRVIYCQSADNNYNKFYNNQINYGSYNVYFFGSSTSATNVGNEWIGNEFNDAYYRGLYLYYNTDMKFNHNKVNTNTPYTSAYGLMSYYSYDNAEVIGNQVHFPYVAAYLYYNQGTSSKSPLIANNWFASGDGTYYAYGMYLYYGGFARVVNNTIWKYSNSSYGYYGIYMYSGGGNSFLNNILYDPQGSTGYYTFYLNGGFTLLDCDYNNVFSKTNYGYFNGVQKTLADWQSATGYDMNSISTDPGFTKGDSLRTCNDTIDGAGTPLSYIYDDIDGDGRNLNTPDIGADEFVGSDSGAYSAGPDAFVCDGKTAVIGLNVTGATFLWNTSDTTGTIEVSQAGTYTVQMTTSCGATHSDQVVVSDITPVANFSKTVSFRTGKFVNASINGNSYMWVVQTSPFDTAYSTDLTYVFPDNGPYQVCLYTMNDCDTAQKCDIWFSPIGIEEVNLEDAISLRPNPVSDQLFIQFKGLESNQIYVELSNVQGQLVYREKYVDVSGNATKSIDVSGLKSGLYIVKFTTENDVVAKRIIVQ